MDQLPQRLEQWWLRLDDGARRRATVMMLICVGFMVHYLVYCFLQPFYIEDSAITYAFSRHLVEGDGLAGYQGGERVEGYSNATWTFLMAAAHAVGLPMWTAAKLFGAVFGVATLPLIYRITRRAMPDLAPELALVAPALLAASVQYVLWAAAGLENSLLCFLLAAGMARLLGEFSALDRGERPVPWSALLFVLLAMTRPEGVAYGVFAGVAMVLDGLRARRIGHMLRWVAAFFVPFVAYHAWRYSYFGWPLPNTYYAKLGTGKSFKPFNWTGGGWKYVQGWFVDHGVVYLMPLAIMGLTGLRSWARWVGVAVVAWLSVVVLWDGGLDWELVGLETAPDWWRPVKSRWVELRVWSIAGCAGVLGLLTLGHVGWRARGLLWLNASFGVFFAVYANGDWMDQHRWFNVVVLNLLPVLAVGLGELLDATIPAGTPAPGLGGSLPLRGALCVVLLGAWTAGEARHDYTFCIGPETSPRDIHRRVHYMAMVQRRLDVDNVTLLDVDMGAHQFYSGWDIVDIAGLIDVPMAHHSDFNKKFIREYIFEQRKPEFAHVHAGWARSSKIPSHPEWRREYIEVPGYPIGGDLMHVGNHVRKDLFVHPAPSPDLPETAERFGRRLDLVSLELRAPEVEQGTAVMVEMVWHATHLRSDFRILLFLVDDQGEVVHVEAVAPAWGWYPVRRWRVDEWIDSRHELKLDESIVPGDYRVGLVVLDDKSGGVLAHTPADDAPPPGEPAYLAGELLTAATVKVRSAAEARSAAQDDLQRAFSAAEGGSCGAVWPAWKQARAHRLHDGDWMEATDFEVRRALASCLVAQAESAESLDEENALLIEARTWDRHNPELVPRARIRAREVAEEARLAFAEADWETAQALAEESLALDPMQSHLRVLAEDARDNKLRIVRPGRSKDDLPPKERGDEDDEEGPRKLEPVGGADDGEEGAADDGADDGADEGAGAENAPVVTIGDEDES